MKKSYSLAWLLIFGCAGFALFWGLYGRAFVRRTYFAPRSVAASARTEHQFVAILIPRVRRDRERFAISAKDLQTILGALKKSGHTAIGLADVEALYSRGVPLPPKALLIAFAENEPLGYDLSDRVLRRPGMRGVAFISKTAEEAGGEHRAHLTRHAISQM